ncbi:MAG: winged helix-turn-helix domain-containing protein [Candidatus ainarchaeum sp.]|nr:winged helix-turn-helix domain-containing protein [Candidatus ainarchaeum sp.]
MDRLVLDNKSFKALSSDSRVNILKQLTNRRMTLSELSNKLDLKSSTIKEHCEILNNANLIKQIDEGRKWKYYELTNKGKQIITPNPFEETKILLLLCIGAILIGIIGFFILNISIENTNFTNSTIGGGAQDLVTPRITQDIQNYPILPKSNEMLNETEISNLSISSENETSIISNNGYFIDYLTFITSIISAILIGILVGWFVRKKTIA